MVTNDNQIEVYLSSYSVHVSMKKKQLPYLIY